MKRILVFLAAAAMLMTACSPDNRTGTNNGVQNGGDERSIKVFDHGVPLNFDEDLAKKILLEEAVDILVELEDGSAKGTAWGCDLTYDYVKINGDYRT